MPGTFGEFHYLSGKSVGNVTNWLQMEPTCFKLGHEQTGHLIPRFYTSEDSKQMSPYISLFKIALKKAGTYFGLVVVPSPQTRSKEVLAAFSTIVDHAEQTGSYPVDTVSLL